MAFYALELVEQSLALGRLLGNRSPQFLDLFIGACNPIFGLADGWKFSGQVVNFSGDFENFFGSLLDLKVPFGGSGRSFVTSPEREFCIEFLKAGVAAANLKKIIVGL